MLRESHGGSWAAVGGAWVWTPTKQKKEGRKCAQCGNEFNPRRTNHWYCKEPCKKAAECERRKARTLVNRQIRHAIAETEALKYGDYGDINWIRANRKRDGAELAEMLNNSNLKSDPHFNQEVEKLLEYWSKVGQGDVYEQLRRKSPKSFADKMAIDNLFTNTHHVSSIYEDEF